MTYILLRSNSLQVYWLRKIWENPCFPILRIYQQNITTPKIIRKGTWCYNNKPNEFSFKWLIWSNMYAFCVFGSVLENQKYSDNFFSKSHLEFLFLMENGDAGQYAWPTFMLGSKW